MSGDYAAGKGAEAQAGPVGTGPAVGQRVLILDYSRDTSTETKNSTSKAGEAALYDVSRKKPRLKNRGPEAVEQAKVGIAVEFPAFGRLRATNEPRKEGGIISPGGVRSVWLRNDLDTFKKRLQDQGQPRPRPAATVNGSTRPFRTSSTASCFARNSTALWRNCRLTWTLGWRSKIGRCLTQGATATARRPGRPSSKAVTWPWRKT